MNKNLPYFYSDNLVRGDAVVMLDEANSKHMVQVLRMKAGEAFISSQIAQNYTETNQAYLCLSV